MALLFIDSFDHYATADLTKKWTSQNGSPTIVAGAGRRGTAAFKAGSGSSWVLKGVNPGAPGVVVGFGWNPANISPAYHILSIWDAINVVQQLTLRVNTDGSFSVLRGTTTIMGTGGTVLGSSAAGVISTGVWCYVEFKAVLDDVVGTVDVHVNGASVIALSDVDTLQGGTTYTAVALGVNNSAPSGNHYFDDLYICDTAGGVNDDFLGDSRVDAHLPNGAGATSDWTPSAGDNYACVDESSPNDDTDYDSTNVLDAVDTYDFPDLANPGGTMYGVQILAACKKSDAGTCSLQPVVRRSGTDYPSGNDHALGTTYAYHLRECFDVDPSTGAAWSEANFNAEELGIKKTA